MLTLISLILTLIGSANWFCIGLLQFDFVAGLFGSQSSIFSRIIYFLIGVGAIYLTFTLIKNKGKLKFNFKKFKNKVAQKLSKSKESNEEIESTPVKRMTVEKKRTPTSKRKTIKLIPKNYQSSLAHSMAEHSKEVYKQEEEHKKDY